jgi:hypothetical protein
MARTLENMDDALIAWPVLRLGRKGKRERSRFSEIRR